MQNQPPMAQTPPPMAPPPPPMATDVTSNDKLWAALSYLVVVLTGLPIVGIIVVLMDDTKNRQYPRYHAIQSFGFTAAVWIYFFIAFIIFFCGSAVTLGLGACVLWILFLLPLIPGIIYTVQAYNGKYIEIPVVTNFMVQQGWLQRPV